MPSSPTVNREEGLLPMDQTKTVETSVKPRPARLDVRRWVDRLANKSFLPYAGFAVFFLVWEIVGRTINPILFATPTRVLAAYPILITSGELSRAFWITVRTLVTGYVLAAVIGISLAFLTARVELVRSLLDPYIETIYATPRVVLVPLTIVWFGIGFPARVFLVFIGTFIPILINTATGLRHTDAALLEVGRSFGADEWEMFRHIRLPSAIPYIMAGLRIGIGRALVGVIVAEMFLDLTGLGGLIMTHGTYFRTDRMLAVVLVLSVMGIVLMRAAEWIEHKISPWKVSVN